MYMNENDSHYPIKSESVKWHKIGIYTDVSMF